ncbi:hypothetical protein BSL78_14637 [Apostichopus japonicus]|uniref:ZU5 domain-containing protein n=1 Tax=Stichopus japonicus TaxID=307972 RepID=A0A2G8KKK3_STIJA|nr:hypothetical protein BSL78_14637 [Apostichopus japonicus]
MKIIPQPCDAQDALKFERNSVVVVELLPNNCRFQCPVSLTLPHCLQLKEEYERNSIDVLISHHDEGFKPKWELLHDARFNLCKENCTISLKSFCWVTYEIHDKIVEAKRIKLYTAGKKMRLKDRITKVEVGFYPDLPGSGKILELNKDMHLSQRKPFVFLKTGEEPLLINLHKVVPKEWNNSQPDENPKIIPFDSVSISEERSCPFVLERSGDDTDIPLCIFKVGQKGRNDVELTIRPDVLTA